MTRTERIAQALQRRIEANNFKEITITMKCNGDVLTIRPCSVVDIKSIKDIEYYMVDSPSLPWLGSRDIMLVAKDLDNYANLIRERDLQITMLKNDIRENGYLENGYVRDWVSDWYKDLFGRRPRFNSEKEAREWASR